MRRGILAALFLAGCLATAAQQALNNESVIKMAKAGLTDDVILATINSTAGAYDTSPDGLIALKQAGVSDKVIAAVVSKASTPASVAPPPPLPPAPDAAPPGAVSTALPEGTHEVGIYYKDSSGAWQPVNWEVVIFESGGVVKHVASAGLIKHDLNGVIGGARSRLIVNIPARFILHVPDGVSPLDYRLVRLHVNGNNRQFQSAAGELGHESAGSDRDDVEFTTKELGSSAYEVVINGDLGNGEYGFIAPVDAATQKAASGRIFTFAIVQ
jgi:hypothetical protein